MKLVSIELTNFRQFLGTQHFALATTEGRNVSLLFGANGAGKTTLLNAFTWALYGEMSQDVEEQVRIANDSAWRATRIGDSLDVSVTVTFEHEGHSFKAQRHAAIRKASEAQTRVTPDIQLWITENGESRLSDAPQRKIDSVLPKQLSRFFFFNGERIDKLVHRKAYAEVKQDIKTLLGLEQVERALEHLPKVERKFSNELRKLGGERAADIQGQIETQQDRLGQLRTSLQRELDEIAALTEDREGVVDLLRQHSEAGPLQRQLDEAETALVDARRMRDRHEAERMQVIATKGFLAFSGVLADRSSELAAELHQRGSLPAPIKREFVDSILEARKCICDTDLLPGSRALLAVEGWREKAGLAEVEGAWQRLSGQVSNLRDARAELRTRIQTLTGDVTSDRASIDRLEGQVSELREMVRQLPLEEVSRLEGRRQDLQSQIDTHNGHLGVVRRDVADAETQIEQLRGQLRAAEVGDEQAQTAKRRMELVQTVEETLKQILEIRSADMKQRLDTKVKAVFAKITVKPFYPELNDDFELSLLQRHEDGAILPVPKSTGENQILSLSFVAAVSELAREVSAERAREEGVHQDWGTYPIVMDAAFGSLDLNYQREVSRALAEMAPQMVVLVSKSQGQGQVLAELKPYVNHLGVIVSHSTNTAQDSETIELLGRDFPYIRTGADSNWAELLEVTNDSR